MLRFLLVLLLLAFVPLSGRAAPIVLKSGEHPDHTRVVFHVPDGVNWKAKEGSKSLVLLFEMEQEFDLSEAFDRIGRNRISDIFKVKGGVELSYACDCISSIYQSGDKMIVVEVKEKAKKDSVDKSSLDFKNAFKPIEIANFQEEISKSDPMPDSHAKISNKDVVDSKIVRNRLFHYLGRAASMGFVELTVPDYKLGLGLEEQQPETEGHILPYQAGIYPHGTLDPEVDLEIEKNPVSEAGLMCLDEELLDTSSWIYNEDYWTGLTDLRSKLGGDVYPIDQKTAIILVKHYLAYGFGAEAKLTLDQIDLTKEGQLLFQVASLLEGEAHPSLRDMINMQSCKSDAAIWGLLASHQLLPNEQNNVADPDHIVRAFWDMPSALQDALSNRVGQALIEMGELEAARAVNRIIERHSHEIPADLKYLSSKLAINNDDEPLGEEFLATGFKSEKPLSPALLAELVEAEFRAGREISVETADLLGGYYTQYKSEKIAPRLLKALVLSNAFKGRFEESWKLLKSAQNQNFDLTLLRSQFASALVKNANLLEFVRFGANLANDASKLIPEANLQMANRMFEVGFPDIGRHFLSDPAEGEFEHQRRKMLAVDALKSGDPVTAKSHLLGLVGPDIDPLYARMSLIKNEGETSISDKTSDHNVSISLENVRASIDKSKSYRENLREKMKAIIN